MLRPRFQFRLKTLMLLVVVAAGMIALIAWMADFGRQRWIARVQRQDDRLLLATQTQAHSVAFFEAEDEQLVFFFKRHSGAGSFGGRPKILTPEGDNLFAPDESRPGVEHLLPGEGTIREWTDELMGNRPQGYQYPIRRGYRGKLRFQFSWDYVDEKQNIVLDVTIPWRADVAP